MVHVLTLHTYNLKSINTIFLTQKDNPTWCLMSVTGHALRAKVFFTPN